MGGLPKRSGLFFCRCLFGRKGYCPEDLPLRSIPPRLTARCLPLTAAGGQGPSGQHRLRTCTSAPSLPLRCACGSLPLTAAGGQGHSGQHRLRTCTSASTFPRLTARCPSRQWNRISLGLSRWPPVLKPWLSGRSMSVRAAPLRIRSFSSGRYFW